MDEIYEHKLTFHRRIENIVKNIEQNEANTNAAMEDIRRKSETNKTSIGPANDLLRYLYILEQQYQNDSSEIRTKTRENLLEYIDQFRQSDDVVEEENDDPEPEQPGLIVLPNPPPPTIVSPPSQLSPVIRSPSQLPTVVPPPYQLPPVVLPSSQPSLIVHPPSQLAAVVLSERQPSASSKSQPSLSRVTDPDHIRPETLVAYERLLFDAQQYENRYKTIDRSRKSQLAGPLKDIMNKLRTDTFELLKNQLFQYLTGQQQKIGDQIIHISNDEERLLCLSMLATLTLSQLLGGDLTQTKSDVFLPLVSAVSQNPQHKEFRTIFLDRLHKKCPYTVPLYPKRQPTMDDKQYLEAMGYIERQDVNERRLETDDEFLVRMSGLIRLFCKLLINRIPPFDKDLSFGWTWCSDVLNLPPRPNITLILIRVFLEEAGEAMMKEYPSQFPKIIQVIRRNLPQLGQGTSDSEISRLRTALTKFP